MPGCLHVGSSILGTCVSHSASQLVVFLTSAQISVTCYKLKIDMPGQSYWLNVFPHKNIANGTPYMWIEKLA
jgi:hypothetical protein